MHWLRATRAANKLLHRLATLLLLRHRLLLRAKRRLLRHRLLLRAKLRLLRATLLLRLPLLLRTLALLLRLRAQASKLYSRGARPKLRLQRASKRTAGRSDGLVRCAAGKQKSHEPRFVAFLFVSARSLNVMPAHKSMRDACNPRGAYASGNYTTRARQRY
ncbi:hypothetical protein PSAC2689_90117 [Paraburkholderia sacchari]